MKRNFLPFSLLIFCFFIFDSCASLFTKPPVPVKPEEPVIEEEIIYTPILSRMIKGEGQLNATQLALFLAHANSELGLPYCIEFAFYYTEEAKAEGINSDVAFAQMCLETGYLRFGNLVQPEFHNYCGLGAMDAEHPGEIFETEQLGVRAHVQHLQAYATHEDELLNNELIDPRYSWVHKTKYVEDIFGLAGTWATDPRYGEKIDGILRQMEKLLIKE